MLQKGEYFYVFDCLQDLHCVVLSLWKRPQPYNLEASIKWTSYEPRLCIWQDDYCYSSIPFGETNAF